MDLAALLIACGAATLAGLALVVSHQSRVNALPDVAQLSKAAIETRAEVAALRAEWTTYLKALDAALEALEEQSGTVQRHRARVEQANRRADQREAPENSDPVGELYRRARAQGIEV